MVVIVISGKPGSGSSTAARLLAKKLRLKHFSAGDYYKKIAGKYEKGKTTEKSIKFLKTKKGSGRDFNRHVDEMQASIAKKGNVVIESKIGVAFVKDADLRVWVEAPASVRALRYKKREGFNKKQAIKYIREKDALERKTFKKLYRFDSFSQKKMADTVINTGNKTPREIVGIMIKKLRQKSLIN